MKLLPVILLLLLVNSNHAADFLAIIPVAARSHWILAETYLRGLADRGHAITVISPFRSTQPPPKWTEITIADAMHLFGNSSDNFNWSLKNLPTMVFSFLDAGSKVCELHLQSESIQKLYHSQKKFDAVIFEPFMSECFLAFSYKFKAPVIGLVPFSGTSWIADMVGNPYPFAYVPEPILGYSDHMTFSERLSNTCFGTFSRLIRQIYTLPKQDHVMRHYLNDSTIPSISEIETQAALVLVNSHVSIGYPRPLVPNMIEVGGLHVKPPKKLPQDLQKFLDESEKGVIYFSLGSNLKSAEMPIEKRDAFIAAFSKLKYKVLWKWEDESLPGKPANVKVGKWFPQSDILAHKNIVLFITHGGVLSTTEAVYREVPLLGIPIFADQVLNMNKAQQMGYGIKLEFGNVSAESLSWAVSEILDNPRYREKVKQLSQIIKDRPMSPLDEAIFWTEYVVRHKGARHMRSAALDLTWYQYLLLDVIAFLLVVLAVTLSILWLLFKTVGKVICNRSEKQSITRKKKGKKDD